MQHQTMPAKTTAMQGPLPAGHACNMQSQRPPPIIMHASDEACHPCCMLPAGLPPPPAHASPFVAWPALAAGHFPWKQRKTKFRLSCPRSYGSIPCEVASCCPVRVLTFEFALGSAVAML